MIVQDLIFHLNQTKTQLSLDVDIPENIAIGHPAWQSSVYLSYDAHRAVDGNDQTNFWFGTCTHTENVGDEYWAVDLGKSYWIKSLKIASRTDCCRKFLQLIHLNNCCVNTPCKVTSLSVIENLPISSKFFREFLFGT